MFFSGAYPSMFQAQFPLPVLPVSRPVPSIRGGFAPRHISAALGASLLMSALLMMHAGLVVDPLRRSDLPYYAAAAIAAALWTASRRSRWHHARAIGDGAEYVASFTVVALIGAVTSYPIAAMTHGYADPTLHRIDVAFGFDWLGWYRTVAAHRWLQIAGIAAYESIYLTPAVLLGWFAFTGQRGAAHRFLAAFWIAAVVTLALFALMPAVGPFSYLWHGPAPYMPVSELWQPDLIPALRAHEVRIVDLGQLRGIVSAPSFHAASATLYLATAWRTPPLRWPLVAVTLAMALATPVEGTHYLTDMVIGAVVALVALAAAEALAWVAEDRVKARAVEVVAY